MALETKADIIVILLKYLLKHQHGVLQMATATVKKSFEMIIFVMIIKFETFEMILKQVLFRLHIN